TRATAGTGCARRASDWAPTLPQTSTSCGRIDRRRISPSTMMKKILIGLVVVLGGFAAFVATRPNVFHIERSATINAPADVVFGQVANFHNWAAWSPWDKLDPSMKRTFAGPESGTGASYSWVGNDKVGEGTQTITGAEPNVKIAIKLEFKKPWEAT